MLSHKVCSKCKEQKITTEFYKGNRYADGLQSYCKSCSSAASLGYSRTLEGKLAKQLYEGSTKGKVVRRQINNKYRSSDHGRQKINEYKRKQHQIDKQWNNFRRRCRKYGAQPELYQLIMVRDRCCQYCWIHEDLTIDHIVPISKGGKSIEDNLQVLCRSCNASKGNRNGER